LPQEIPNSDRWFIDEVQVHAAALRGWLRGKFPTISDPDNMIQETLTRVWRARETSKIQSPKALLYATAHNLAVDQLRRQQIARIEPLAEMADLHVYEESPTPADATVSNQELEFLTHAIQSLPDRCRQVLTLRKIYGLSQKEIATQLGIAEHTVEAQVANGMRRCAEFFGRLGLP
jgi:RNA polymerase sigma-70 factor (ECF subfamily)